MLCLSKKLYEDERDPKVASARNQSVEGRLVDNLAAQDRDGCTFGIEVVAHLQVKEYLAPVAVDVSPKSDLVPSRGFHRRPPRNRGRIVGEEPGWLHHPEGWLLGMVVG